MDHGSPGFATVPPICGATRVRLHAAALNELAEAGRSKGRPQFQPVGNTIDSRTFRSAAALYSGHCRKVRVTAWSLPRHDRSLGNGVLVDDAVLHDDQKPVRRVSNEVDVFQGIAVDHQEIGQGTLFNDAQLAGIRVAQA